ncbi:hypothetical protein [Actinomadura kijaniata]|uniref:hypothetical protein n=1 Tax=Actinomadura kijaniata TaxID=46161 RepID=UPI0012F7E27E|nr:hypothetical protein [Actinomadura kijaniata]
MKPRNLRARLGATLAVTAVAVAPGLATVDAAHAETKADRYCAVLVGKATGGKPSPVLARACDGTSAANARAKMLQASKDGPQATALAATLLMTWYANTDYRVPATSVYGSAGPCDSAGYRLRPDSYWSRNLSSARGSGSCNTARFANIAGTYSRTFALPVPYLGSALNDNVGTIWVYYR